MLEDNKEMQEIIKNTIKKVLSDELNNIISLLSATVLEAIAEGFEIYRSEQAE